MSKLLGGWLSRKHLFYFDLCKLLYWLFVVELVKLVYFLVSSTFSESHFGFYLGTQYDVPIIPRENFSNHFVACQ